MSKLSVVIPAWNEPFLNRTVDDIFKNATGDIEVIASLDGPLPENMPKDDSRLTILRHNSPGMRGSINEGLKVATGKYIMKLDAHCGFSEGFDELLLKNMEESWLLVPRRYSLNEPDWSRNIRMGYWDYHYASYPFAKDNFSDMVVVPWKRPERDNLEIDDTMILQGSCWLADRNFFMKNVGLLDDRNTTYGNFTGEQQEICFKYWLVAGGECKVIKNVWYTHFLKMSKHYNANLFNRKRKVNSMTSINQSWLTKHWLRNEEPNLIHDFSWLIDKFWPIPSWPEEKSLWTA